MKNQEFNLSVNEDLFKKSLELSKKNTEIASVTLKAITTIVNLLSNLSITNIPNIVIDVAKLSSPLIQTSLDLAEIKKMEIEYIKALNNLKKEVELPELDKVNPIVDNLENI
jgi:membrane-anchored glycerophosphoryl diester phosphodiesterase (GDPDase)